MLTKIPLVEQKSGEPSENFGLALSAKNRLKQKVWFSFMAKKNIYCCQSLIVLITLNCDLHTETLGHIIVKCKIES